MKSVQGMVADLETLDDDEISEWERSFIANIGGRMRMAAGSTKFLTGPQIERIPEVWRQHFGKSGS